MEYRVEQLSIGPHRNPPRSESSGSGTKNSMSRARGDRGATGDRGGDEVGQVHTGAICKLSSLHYR